MTSAGRLPEFVVAGFPKAGTTTLADWLAQRDDVFIPIRKEVHFFDQSWGRGVDWYRSQFRAARSDQMCGDATPGYLARPGALQRMVETLDQPRIIVMVREPVSRAQSHYWYFADSVGLDLPPLREVVIRGVEDPESDRHGIVAWGRYELYLRQLDELVPTRQVLVITLDELQDAPGAVAADVSRFLGLEATVNTDALSTSSNQSFTYRSVALSRMMIGVGVWHRSPGLARRVEMWNRRPVERPPLDDDLSARLTEFYEPWNRLLGARLGDRAPSWTA